MEIQKIFLEERSKLLSPERNLNNDLQDVIYWGYKENNKYIVSLNTINNINNETALIIKESLLKRQSLCHFVELNNILNNCSIVYFCHYNSFTQLDTHFFCDYDNEEIKEIIINNSGLIISERIIKSTSLLIIDTETTGIPKKWDVPYSDNYPRIVQIAWILVDGSGNFLNKKSYIIKPVGFEIPPEAFAIYKISTSNATDNGYDLTTVLKEFSDNVVKCKYIVGHNIEFDKKVIASEFYRCNIPNPFDEKIEICTMKSSTDFCAIPSPYGYKYPKLSELYKKLFGKEFAEAHDAVKDVDVTLKCLLKLKEIGVIRLSNYNRNSL